MVLILRFYFLIFFKILYDVVLINFISKYFEEEKIWVLEEVMGGCEYVNNGMKLFLIVRGFY